ncbi:hypothetical protein BGV40_10210 [Methanosarcina sp. Ant1]|nr:hypothetical protein BGV40_10210 [Methanosarcina sp. Ant1]
MDLTVFKYFELIATGLGSFGVGILGALYKARRDTSAALAEAAQHPTPQEIIDLFASKIH